MDALLTDRVVLVVGGSTGVGAGVVRAALREGATVVATGRSEAKGAALLSALATSAEGGRDRVSFVVGDQADPAQARGVVAETIARHGRVDCLVTAAGLTTRGTLLDTTPELFDEHVAVNLRGPFFAMQAAVADMVGRGAPGTIVTIITTSAHGGQPYLAPYVASKAGLVGLTKNVAHAHRFDRVRVNGLCIGWTETEGEAEIQRRYHGGGEDWATRAAAGLPMGRLGQVDEIADAVVFLLSDRSGVVTGSVIDWDQSVVGGYD